MPESRKITLALRKASKGYGILPLDQNSLEQMKALAECLDAILETARSNISGIFGPPETPIIRAWLRGATIKCLWCGHEVEPLTDACGQVLRNIWVHYNPLTDRELADDPTNVSRIGDITEQIKCPYTHMWLYSDLKNNTISDWDDVIIEE